MNFAIDSLPNTAIDLLPQILREMGYQKFELHREEGFLTAPASQKTLEKAAAVADMRANEKLYGYRARTVRVAETMYKDILVPEEKIKEAKEKYFTPDSGAEAIAARALMEPDTDQKNGYTGPGIVHMHNEARSYASAGRPYFEKLCDGDKMDEWSFLYDGRQTMPCTYYDRKKRRRKMSKRFRCNGSLKLSRPIDKMEMMEVLKKGNLPFGDNTWIPWGDNRIMYNHFGEAEDGVLESSIHAISEALDKITASAYGLLTCKKDDRCIGSYFLYGKTLSRTGEMKKN